MRMQASVQKHKFVGKAVEKRINKKKNKFTGEVLVIFSQQFSALLPVDKHTGSLGLQVWRCPVVESCEGYKNPQHDTKDKKKQQFSQ